MRARDVTVPGKVMLAGEYTALRGGEIVAATLDAGFSMRLEWQEHAAFAARLRSDLWQEEAWLDGTTLACIEPHAPLFESAAWGLQHLKRGTLTIDVATAHLLTGGFGSSSAIRLGILAGAAAMQDTPDMAELGLKALEQQRRQQGQASGYDLQTQVHGGVIRTRAIVDRWPTPHVLDLARLRPHFLLYTGGKGAPTTSTMRDTLAWLEATHAWAELQRLNAELVDALDALSHGFGVQSVIAAAAAVRELLMPAPHTPRELFATLKSVPGCDRTWTFKATGAGGEDAVLVITSRERGVWGDEGTVAPQAGSAGHKALDKAQIDAAFAKHGWSDSGLRLSSDKLRVSAAEKH